MYVSGGTTNDVYVFSYPAGKLVQTLTGFQYPNGECTDSSGDVFVTNIGGQGVIDEYAHGGPSPINILQGAYAGTGCSVDPTTGNVAAPSGNDDLAIWTESQGAPTLYHNPYGTMLYCAYDNDGNLFSDGTTSGGWMMSVLRAGSSSFNLLAAKGARIGAPGQVQWDGKHVTIQDARVPGTIYSFSISGSNARLARSTQLTGITKSAGASWIQGSVVIVPFGVRPGGPKQIGYWKYPKGGEPTHVLSKFSFSRRFQGVTVSIGSSGP